jgi:hypothetical protein
VYESPKRKTLEVSFQSKLAAFAFASVLAELSETSESLASLLAEEGVNIGV